MKILWLWLVVGGIARGYGAGNRPLILVPGLTGSALEVKERDSPMPHFWCKRTSNEWMQIWVSAVLRLQLPTTIRMQQFSCFFAVFGSVWCPVMLSLQVQALPWEIDCLMARMTLTYDAATDVYSFLVANSSMLFAVCVCVRVYQKRLNTFEMQLIMQEFGRR